MGCERVPRAILISCVSSGLKEPEGQGAHSLEDNHEDDWATGGITPHILNFGTRWR